MSEVNLLEKKNVKFLKYESIYIISLKNNDKLKWIIICAKICKLNEKIKIKCKFIRLFKELINT